MEKGRKTKQKIKNLSISGVIISVILLLYILINCKINEYFLKTIVRQWSVWLFALSTTATIISFKFLNACRRYVK